MPLELSRQPEQLPSPLPWELKPLDCTVLSTLGLADINSSSPNTWAMRLSELLSRCTGG